MSIYKIQLSVNLKQLSAHKIGTYRMTVCLFETMVCPRNVFIFLCFYAGNTAVSKLRSVESTADSQAPRSRKHRGVASTAKSQISTFKQPFWDENTAESQLRSACDTDDS